VEKRASKALRRWFEALLSAVLVLGCSVSGSDVGKRSSDGARFGSAEMALVLPSAEHVETVDLHLVCANLDQHHLLNVANGEVVAAFGGLAPGACFVEGTASSLEGSSCVGHQDFAIVADQVSQVTLTLMCQGRNESPSGAVLIDVDFDFFDCSEDRLAGIEADPGSLLLGESTVVSATLDLDAIVGSPSVSFMLRSDAAHDGEAALSSAASCSGFECIQVTCLDVGESPEADPQSGLLSAQVLVAVTVEDDQCFDTELIAITCLRESVCGDLLVSGVEQCDDGNTDGGDGCSAECELEYCGDGVRNQTSGIEECDGDDGLVDPLLQDCDPLTCHIVPICNNGFVEGTEECDDGNASNTDACTNVCNNAVCGDGFTRSGVEQCDDGNASNTDACTNVCNNAVCGDGFTQSGVEQCDDGNAFNTDACLNSCLNAVCGDGFTRAGVEQCDDGNASNTDACTNVCNNAVCGDGFTRSGVEQCDDGNASNTDACVAGCVNASCGDGFARYGVEQCDDANATNTDGCISTCESALISDDFDRADSTTIGGVWTEVTSGAANAVISGNKLRLDGDDGSNRPLVKTAFATQTSGSLMWSFDMDFTYVSEATSYFQFMQLGDGMVDGNQVTGVAVDLSWGRYSSANNQFGYKNTGGTFFNAMGGTTQLVGLHRVQVFVDIASKTYDVRIDDVLRVSGAPFRSAAVTQISQMRFFQHTMTSTATGRTIDNVKLTKGVLGDNFTRAGSSTIGGGWTEVLAAVNPGDAEIMTGRLQFNGANGIMSPLVTQGFPANHAGTMTWAFTMSFARTTEVNPYFQFMQLGDAPLSTDQVDGVAVDLSWGSYGVSHSQFGYKNSAGTFVNVMGGTTALTGSHYIVVVVNFATASYDIKVDGTTHATAVPFRDSTVTQITDVRYFEDQMDSTATGRTIDNVAISLP
jgi:cysteine-rich repeat protein